MTTTSGLLRHLFPGVAVTRFDAARIWAVLDKVMAKHSDMVLLHGGTPRGTPERRAWYTRGCADTCPCHGLPHARCPKAKPCLGDCGRLTTAHETIASGYCVHCAADTGWRPIA